VALELRSGLSGVSILSPHIQRLELTRGGCPVLQAHQERNATIENASMTLHLPKPVVADGCWFEVPASSSAQNDPKRYLIEAYDEMKNVWKTIGSSGMTGSIWHPETRHGISQPAYQAEWTPCRCKLTTACVVHFDLCGQQYLGWRLFWGHVSVCQGV
jgi:hypothetical protein